MLNARLLPWLVLLAVLASCGEPQPSEPPAPAATRDGQWRQDVEYVCANIVRLHKDAFFNVDEEVFDAARDRLLVDVPELSDIGVIVRLSSIVALLRDAHTTLPIGGFRFPELPIRFHRTSEGLFLIGLPEEHRSSLGGRVVAVGGVAFEQATERVGAMVSHENRIGLDNQVPRLLRMPVVLFEFGLCASTDAVSLDVETEDGVYTIEIGFGPDGTQPSMAALERDSIPLASQRTDERYWHRTLPEHQAVYLAYNSCIDDEARPFSELAAEVLHELENPDIERLIIDLRRNRGGSQLVARPLWRKLSGHRLDRPGGILVLVGARTFSSGKGDALYLRRETAAVLIGNPLGTRLNSFGEVKLFHSPNAGLTIGYSTKRFVRGSDHVEAVMPDVTVPFTLADWKRGRDPVFQAALVYE